MDIYFGNNYITNGDNIYRTNGVYISRIVKFYECSECNHLSKNIVESDIHHKTNHTKNIAVYNQNNKTVLFKENNNKLNNKSKINNKNEPKLVQKTIVNKIVKSVDNKKPKEIIIKPLVKTDEGKRDKSIHYINIESGFKEFEEINCVKSLKTYSRKKLSTNEIELSEEKVDNNESGGESGESLTRIPGVKLFECDICGEVYSAVLLNSHKNIHTNPQICNHPFCDEKFATEKQLKEHEKIHEIKVAKKRGFKPIQPFKCDLCEHKYTTQLSLIRHRNIHTNPRTCDFQDCGKKFSTDSKLKFHKLTHNKSYKYKCLLCNKVFPYFHRLRQHKKFHTDPVVCEHEGCGKKFENYSEMKLHSICHSEDRPYTCDLPNCQFRAKSTYQVMVHKSYVHSNYRPYKCDWKGCGKSFKTTSTLGTHINCTHKNIRKYVCDWPDCTNKYLNNYALTVHMRSHTGERPYVCSYPDCGKRFGSNLVLSRHESIHLGLRPFQCNYCGATFAAKSTMNTHKKLIHKCDYIKRSNIDNKIQNKRLNK